MESHNKNKTKLAEAEITLVVTRGGERGGKLEGGGEKAQTSRYKTKKHEGRNAARGERGRRKAAKTKSQERS